MDVRSAFGVGLEAFQFTFEPVPVDTELVRRCRRSMLPEHASLADPVDDVMDTQHVTYATTATRWANMPRLRRSADICSPAVPYQLRRVSNRAIQPLVVDSSTILCALMHAGLPCDEYEFGGRYWGKQFLLDEDGRLSEWTAEDQGTVAQADG
jgi:hypothetical protein